MHDDEPPDSWYVPAAQLLQAEPASLTIVNGTVVRRDGAGASVSLGEVAHHLRPASATRGARDPGLAADSGHRQAVLGYLEADSISVLPFRRLAGADTARASQLFQHLLKKPGFSWERDGEALLRKHKPWCFGAKPHPPVTPLSTELAKALPSSK